MIIRIECEHSLENKVVAVKISRPLETAISDIISNIDEKNRKIVKSLIESLPDYLEETERNIYMFRLIYRVVTGRDITILPIMIVSSYSRLRSRKRVMLCITVYSDIKKNFMYYVSNIDKEYEEVKKSILSSIEGYVYHVEKFMKACREVMKHVDHII
ncbi:MAG: hypothetical protein GXO26_08160 [Crenarchaeota archaeon]|nr:hypothetical protein [Thermoproteota archaeon]